MQKDCQTKLPNQIPLILHPGIWLIRIQPRCEPPCRVLESGDLLLWFNHFHIFPPSTVDSPVPITVWRRLYCRDPPHATPSIMCTALHCTEDTSLYHTSLHCSYTLHCTALHSRLYMHCTTLQCSAVQCSNTASQQS